MEYIQYVIIILLLIIIAFSITRSKRKDFNIETNRLVACLGGKKNIKNYEVNKSRFIVDVIDITKVNKEAIQKLGAQGIVEIDNQLKIILGADAKNLKKYIDELE
ncbi:MAG: hypothetical protein RR847_03500 [Bacilli bacterium]